MTGEVSRDGRCWYCGQATLRLGDPPEHVIPDAMGDTLKTDRVCRACNTRAGREIDAPFMQDWLIAMERVLHAPGGHRMQPRVRAELEDGTPVDIQTGKGPWKATIRGSRERDGDQVAIRASNRAEYERLLARVRRDVEAEGKTFTEPGEPTESETAGPVVIHSTIDGIVWLRMGAKVTLACLSKVLDESWLDSADAVRYRNWLWDAKPVNEDGSPALGFPASASKMDEYVLRPPEHLIYFAPAGKGRVGLSVAFFGSLIVRSVVHIGELPAPRLAWRTGPGAAATETTFDVLIAEAARKHIEAAENASASSGGS